MPTLWFRLQLLQSIHRHCQHIWHVMRRNFGIQNAVTVSVAMDIRMDVPAVRPTEESAVAPVLQDHGNQQLQETSITIVFHMEARAGAANHCVNSFNRQEDADSAMDVALGMCRDAAWPTHGADCSVWWTRFIPYSIQYNIYSCEFLFSPCFLLE